MTFDEAVRKMKEALSNAFDEDHVQDYIQETLEDIAREYYGWNLNAWEESETPEEETRLEEQEIMFEDFAWADIGAHALVSMAADWAKGRPEIGVVFSANQ